MESVVSYARASVDRTGEELSVDRQIEDQRAIASVRQWNIVAELKDNDVSAAGKRRRPGFEAALKMVRDGQATMILATDMTRLTRGKALDEVRLLELGVQTGLKLSFVRAPDLDLSTAAGRLTASILIAAARHEIEQKSERQKRAAAQAAEKGRRTGGRRAFGYGPTVGVDERTGKPIVDYDALNPEEALAIREAYQAILSGVSLGRIAKDWNSRQLHSSQARLRYRHGCDRDPCPPDTDPKVCPEREQTGEPSTWSAQSVRPVLLNPRYAGLRHHVTEAVRDKVHPVKARLQSIVGDAAWPAVVDEATWRAAVEVLTDPARANPGRSGRRLLTGVARCGVEVEPGQPCGSLVHAGANPMGQATYRCRATYGHIGRRADPVDEWVGDIVVARLSRPDARELLAEDEPTDVGALRKELRDLRTRLNSLARNNVLGLIDDQQLRAGTDIGKRREREIEAELVRAGRASILAPLIEADDVQAVWDAMDTDRQRAVVDRLMTVTLLPVGRGTRTFRAETVVCVPREPGHRSS